MQDTCVMSLIWEDDLWFTNNRIHKHRRHNNTFRTPGKHLYTKTEEQFSAAVPVNSETQLVSGTDDVTVFLQLISALRLWLEPYWGSPVAEEMPEGGRGKKSIILRLEHRATFRVPRKKTKKKGKRQAKSNNTILGCVLYNYSFVGDKQRMSMNCLKGILERLWVHTLYLMLGLRHNASLQLEHFTFSFS